MKETQTQFIKRYLKNNNINEEEWNFEYNECAVFCDCEDGGSEGHWAMVRKNSLKDHVELYVKETQRASTS